MPDAESFVAAIAANPADDLPRLVFADWLDENGDPARAGFIRDHVALAKLRPGTDQYKALFRKCADTLRANLPAWIKPACDAFGQPAEWKPGKAAGGRFVILLQDDSSWPLWQVEFSRGLIDQAVIRLSNVKQPQELDNLFRSIPITRLIAVHLPPPTRWEQIATPRLRCVRRLTIGNTVYPDSASDLFASPHLEGVVHVTCIAASIAEQLARSPMARRLTSLRASLHPAVLIAFREYALDDRLQEFALSPAPVSAGTSAAAALLSRYFAAAGGEQVWQELSRVSFRPTLKRLDLTRCGMTDDGLAAFARGEAWLRLQGLKLGGNLFGDRGWADFCRGWRTPELTYLDASRNRLTDVGAELLARSGMMKTLRVIDLRGNRIAGRGAVALARAGAEGKLTKLLLAGNPLHKRDAAAVKGLLGERCDIG